MKQPLCFYDDKEIKYKFHDDHPFNQKRLTLTVDLLQRIGALPDACTAVPPLSEDEHLLRVHAAPYVNAVKELSLVPPDPHWVRQAGLYGLDTEDTPYFPGMHQVTATIVGGSVAAAEAVMSGHTEHALHLAGGLHHALESKGAGFCVYNDASAAIAYIRSKYDAKVLYIDTDVHHGDGVQWMFYADPTVCTFSIHETGKYLFPGTGAINERGDGTAFGTSVNLPMEPYTEDESWMNCFEEVLERTIRHFKPDIIVSQHGCDAHAYDPLAHIHCSMNIYKDMPALIHRYAHDWCGGRWVALGGGGYDIWRVVPRAWSLLWLEMIGHPIISELQRNPLLPLPDSWRQTWQPESTVLLPSLWLDDLSSWEPMPRRKQISEKNESTKQLALQYIG